MTLRYILSSIVAVAFSLAIHANDVSCDSLKRLGDECVAAQRYIEALDLYTEGVKQAEKEQNERVRMACIGNIGNIYARYKDYELALHYYESTYDQALKLQDGKVARKAVENMLGCYCRLKEIDNAKRCLKLLSQMPGDNDVFDHFLLIQHQAMIFEAEGNLQPALSSYIEAHEFAESHNMDEIISIISLGLVGDCYTKLSQYPEAIDTYRSILKVAKQDRYIEQRQSAYQGMSEAYRGLGIADSAALYCDYATSLSDSIYDKQRFNNAKNKLFEYEKELTKREISLLNSRINVLTIAIVVFVLFIITLTVLAVIVMRQKRSLATAYNALWAQNEEQLRLAKAKAEAKAEVETNAEPTEDNAETTERDDVESPLSPSQAQDLLGRINEVMEQSEAIFSPDFSMTLLAKMVDSNTKYVSWVINDTYNKNFKTFLNEYRIRKASRMLTDQDNYGLLTMQAIGEMVGFKSQASFINAFKTILGMTPTMYLKLSIQNKGKEMPQAEA